MTLRQLLEQYNDIRREVQSLEGRIADLQTQEISSCDVVEMSDAEPPFLKHTTKVIGYRVDREALNRLVRQYKSRQRLAQTQLLQVNAFINSIEDSKERELLTLHYIEGLPYWKMPERLGVAGDGSTQFKAIRRIVRKYEEQFHKFNKKGV